MEELRTDRDLLREYAERGDESAFGALVQRHLGLVFATARRRLGDDAAAREVTQNVFVSLARKALRLLGETSLAGWLHQAAVIEARQWWRGELRRQRREHTAAEMGTTMQKDDSLLQSLAGELDEGLLELRNTDRQALMLRYFEARSHREIGTLLGTGEDAARKRIDKALEKLTAFFRRRGYAVPAVAMTVAALEKAAPAAPAGLAALVSQAACQQAGIASVTTAGFYLAKFMAITKTQTALACLLVAAAPMGYQWRTQHDLDREHQRLRETRAASQQTLAESRNQRDALSRRARELQDSIDRLRARLADVPKPPVRPAPDTSLWSEASPYVQVPKAMLAKIKIPALDDQGLLSEDMARALGLETAQVQRVNEALQSFSAKYRELEASHLHPTEEHPTSVSISPTQDQKSFVRDAIPAEYQRLASALQTTVGQAVGPDNLAYLMTNATADEHPEFDPSRAPLATKITLFRPEKEEPGGGPYFMAQEYQYENGTWGSAHMGPLDPNNPSTAALLDTPVIRAVIDEWKKTAPAP